MTPNDVSRALNCASGKASSLLELGRRITRTNVRRGKKVKRATIRIQGGDMCTSGRDKGTDSKVVKEATAPIKPTDMLLRKGAAVTHAAGTTGATIGITALINPLVGAIFGAVTAFLQWCGSQAREADELRIVRKILKRAYYAVSVRVQLEGVEGEKSVLDLARESGKWKEYERAVRDLGNVFFQDSPEGDSAEDLPEGDSAERKTKSPPTLDPSKAKETLDLLLSFAPYSLGTISEIFGLLSDTQYNRAFTVMYLIHCFYLEALISDHYGRSHPTQLQQWTHRVVASQPDAHGYDPEAWKYFKDKHDNIYSDREKNWLNMDTFWIFLTEDLLGLLNGYRGGACLGGLDRMSCCLDPNRSGEEPGDAAEYTKLKRHFSDLSDKFIMGYLKEGGSGPLPLTMSDRGDGDPGGKKSE